jgi:hypothetical protein
VCGLSKPAVLPGHPGAARHQRLENVRDVAPESDIAVLTKQGKKYHGTILLVTAGALTMNSDERAIPAPGRITRQRVLQRAGILEVRLLAPVASVLAGAAIGGGAGVTLGAIADASAQSSQDRGLLIGLLGLLGAAIGDAIGVHNPIVKGKRIYVAR